MRSTLTFFLLFAGLVSHQGWAAGPAVSVVDDSGIEVALSQPARRVVALAPHLTEIMFAVGAGERLVGTVRHSDFPLAARDLPVIGDAAGLSVESLIALRPDLILNWRSGISPAIIARLASLGFVIFQSEPTGLTGVAENIRVIAKLAGHDDAGQAVAGDFLQRLEALRTSQSEFREVSVFYQVWDSPLMTVGSGQRISEAISVCRGRNIFSDLEIPVPQVNIEAVLRRDPEVILFGQAPGMNGSEWMQPWNQFASMAAVRDGHLYAINADLISRPGPRLVDGIAQICRVLDQARGHGG